MDILAESIAATCPLAFDGNAGELFVKAVTAVVAAHCTIFDNHYDWPEDVSMKLIGREDSISYDFIVVGAGTAGSLVASRLSQLHPFWTVLLIEAGDDPGLLSEIPAFIFHNHGTKTDWKYKSVADGNSCLGFKDNRCLWSKGKAMGGSSSTNAMLYVRGHPHDYDEWEAFGNPGWGYDDLKPYFEKIENNFNFSAYKYHENHWYDSFNKAWKELHINHYNDYNNEALIGTTIFKTMIENGKRLNSGKLYLHDSKNLHAMKNTIVEKLIIDKNTKSVTGVHVKHITGKFLQIEAKQEVILSAGSIASPLILMSSGIGPKTHLIERNIEPILDLPVGKNLQDHLYLPIVITVQEKTIISPEIFTNFILEYMLSRSGPLSTVGKLDYTTFINLKNLTNRPDIQFFHGYYHTNDVVFLETYLRNTGYKNEIVNIIMELNKKNDLVIIYPCLLHPMSTGEILLSQNDTIPVIKANYLQHTDDIESFIKAIEVVKKLETTDSFKSNGIKLNHLNISGCSQFTEDTKIYWECYVRNLAMTIYHPVGTVKMGPKSKDSVVDHNLLVHGVKNLRVVDASVMPRIPGGNTMAATLAIAMKAVDVMQNNYKTKDEL